MTCTRRNAEPRKGCPNCEYTIQTKLFHEELDKELRTIKGGTRKGAKRWDRTFLLRMVVEIGSIASKKTGDPDLPILTAMMVSMYRDESAKIQAIDGFNLSQSSGSNTPRKFAVPEDVKDKYKEEDFD